MLILAFTKNHAISYNKTCLNSYELADIWPLFCSHWVNGKYFTLEEDSSIEDNVKNYIGMESLGLPCCL